MKKAFINPNICDKSPFCVSKRACPVGAITQGKSGFFSADTPKVDKDKCVGCGKCVSVCPHQAVSMKN
ncbi:MAG: ATP-binding protein [Clostridiaceae bacterium]